MGNNPKIWKNIGFNVWECKNRIMGIFWGIISSGLNIIYPHRKRRRAGGRLASVGLALVQSGALDLNLSLPRVGAVERGRGLATIVNFTPRLDQ